MIVLIASSAVFAQISPRPARQVDLVVQVFFEGGQYPAGAYLTVQLMDGFGTSQDEKSTNEEGKAQFRTVSGLHRLRVIGPEIVEYNGDLEIQTSEMARLEIVRVRRRLDPASSPSAGGAPASVARFKIPSNARKEFEKGAQALMRQDWQEAKKRFETAIARYPDYDLAYNGLGVAAKSTGDVEAARKSFSKAIEVNPNFAEAYRNLARISFAERKYGEADTLLTKSLSMDPLNAWALATAANSELLTHKYNEAIAHARKAHTVPHEGLAGVHIVAALALEATQRPFEELKEYQLYLDEEPKGRDAVRVRAAVERLSGKAQ